MSLRARLAVIAAKAPTHVVAEVAAADSTIVFTFTTGERALLTCTHAGWLPPLRGSVARPTSASAVLGGQSNAVSDSTASARLAGGPLAGLAAAMQDPPCVLCGASGTGRCMLPDDEDECPHGCSPER